MVLILNAGSGYRISFGDPSSGGITSTILVDSYFLGLGSTQDERLHIHNAIDVVIAIFMILLPNV